MTAAGARLGLFAAGAILLAAAPARAALPLTLSWDAPEGCPAASSVRAELDRLVRFPPGQSPPPLSAEAHIDARDGRWRLRLVTVRDGVTGERTLEADTCASLAHAATLVLALAFGVGDEIAAPPPPPPPKPRPKIVEPPPPPPPPVAAPPPPPPPPPPPAVAPPTVVARPAPPRARTSWAISADGRVARGPLPGLVGNPGLAVEASVGRLSAALRFGAWLPTDDVASPTSARMQYSGAGLDLYVCAAPLARSRFSLWACAEGGGSALRGTSTGGLSAMTRTAPWYTAGAAVRGRVSLARRLALEARVEAVGSLTRPVFAFTDGQVPADLTSVFTVPALVPAAALGLVLTL